MLTKCPACGKEISRAAATCPHCGHPLTPSPKVQKQEGAGIAAVGCGFLVLIAFGLCSVRSAREAERATADVERCVERGVTYFKEIGSYPLLKSEPNTGRLADVVARERCERSTRAFEALR